MSIWRDFWKYLKTLHFLPIPWFLCHGICQHYKNPCINIPCHCTFGRACLMLPYLVQWKTSRWEKWLLDLLHKILEERELVISAPPICLWRHLWVYVMHSIRNSAESYDSYLLWGTKWRAQAVLMGCPGREFIFCPIINIFLAFLTFCNAVV